MFKGLRLGSDQFVSKDLFHVFAGIRLAEHHECIAILGSEAGMARAARTSFESNPKSRHGILPKY